MLKFLLLVKLKILLYKINFSQLLNNNFKYLFPGYISNRKALIDAYDNHNILILPSYTEGQICCSEISKLY